MSFLNRTRIDIAKSRKSGDTAKFVRDLYTLMMQDRRPLNLVWLVCSAFSRGVHYAYLDEQNETLITPKLPEGRKRSKINKIGSWKKHMMARLSLARPYYEVVPDELSIEQINAAEAATAFLRHNSEDQKWDLKRFQIANYILDFGNAFAYLRDYVDPTSMTPIPQFDADGITETMDKDTGKQKIEFVEKRDVGFNIILPHHVLVDSEPCELQEKFEVIVAFERSLEYFDMKYNKKVKPFDFGSSYINYDLSLLSRLRLQNRNVETAMELIYMSKPNTLSDKGEIIIVGGDKIMDRFDWQYKNMSDYPLVHYRYGPPSPGEFWTEPPIVDQIPIQRDMNECASIIQENISNVGHVKWMNPSGSGVTDIDDLSGEMIDYNDGSEPHQAQVSPLPNYEVGHLNMLDKLLEDVQMFHSVSKGSGTPNVRSAVGLNKLEEEDQTPLNIPDSFLREGYKDLGEKLILMAIDKIDTPRLIQYIGEGRRRTINDFIGIMMEGFGKVKVRMVDLHLRYKNRTQALVLEMFNAGMITNNFGRPDPAEAKRLIQFALPETLYDKDDKQRQIAYDENDLLMQGNAVQAQEWENHFIHLDVVEELLNSTEWKILSVDDKDTASLVVQHRESHMGLLAKVVGLPGNGQNEGNLNQPNGQGTPQGV